MWFRTHFLLTSAALLAGCAGLGAGPQATSPSAGHGPAAAPEKQTLADNALTPAQLAEYIGKVSKLEGEAAIAEAKRLEATAHGNAGDRLKLAYLLARDGARPEDLARARELLTGIALDDAGTREIARLLQRIVRLEQNVRQERVKATELQEKIEQLKSLERELQERGQSKPQQAPPQAK
jgi:hypothetical protein